MQAPLRPTSDEELREIVAEAVATKTPLAPVGQGTKSGVGRPVNHLALDLTGLSGVVAYEPDELVLTVRTGAPVDEVVALLADHGQELPFEPPMWATPDGIESRGTIGGMVMTNFSGSRRIKVGAVRDHVLGLKGVSGRAETFKAGGRVVKNVTGYDLSRGLCGSWGTLAIATEVTFKILPKAEFEATILVSGLALAEAVKVMTGAMQQSFDVSSAAHLQYGQGDETTMATVLRLEGFEESVAARIAHATAFLKGKTGVEILKGSPSHAIWDELARMHLPKSDGEALWRLSVSPAAAAAVTQAIRAAFYPTLAPAFAFDWSGGLIWVRLDPGDPVPADLGAGVIRAAIAGNGGGHATLIHGPLDKRAAIDVFQPQAPALAALNARLKSQFDPMGILNPGRMVREGC